MIEQADSYDKGLRILLEALTAISYLKGGEGRAAAIAEYALDHYGKAIKDAGSAESEGDMHACSDYSSEQCNPAAYRRIDRRHVNSGPPCGQAERRFYADRRVNPDRRSKSSLTAEL